MQLLRARVGGPIGVRRETQPVHAAVELYHDVDAARQPRMRQHVELLARMHGGGEMIAVDDFQVGRLEEAFEQQDRAAPARFAAAHGLLQVQHGQALGRRETGHRLFDAMAVGIGLDDRPDGGRRAVRLGRHVIEMTTHGGKVVPQGGLGDRSKYGTRHDEISEAPGPVAAKSN
ncbi:Uncharacterised protein [Bordetella pertussis]|nr:Uncharacterised protein [Bordetella pertussis]